MKKLILTESQEQANFVSEVRYQYRNDPTFIPPLFFSTLNGAWLGGKSFAMWEKHKKEGAVRGVSDILYLQSRGGYSFFAIEMKRSDRRNQKDGGLTESESEWIETARANNGFVSVCYTADEALREFSIYMNFPVSLTNASASCRL